MNQNAGRAVSFAFGLGGIIGLSFGSLTQPFTPVWIGAMLIALVYTGLAFINFVAD